MVKSPIRHLIGAAVMLLSLYAVWTGGPAQALSWSPSDPHRPPLDVNEQDPEPGPAPTRIPSSGDITDLSRPRYATLEGAWAEAVNLSLSGAADNPQIVAAPGGRLWAFWWDAFSGLVATSRASGDSSREEAWSPPVVAPIMVPKLEGEDEWVLNTVEEMPSIVGAGEYAHAFWLGQADEETRQRPLMHSRLSLRSPLQRSRAGAWSSGRAVAETAVVWRVTAAPDGTLHLVYVRPVHSQAHPAGVYHMRSLDGGASWGQPTVLHDDIYYRKLDPERVHLTVAADGGERVYVTWDDVRLEKSFMTASGDGGASWAKPQLIRTTAALAAEGQEGVQRARVVPTRKDTLLLWEAGGPASGCTLYQRQLVTATAAMTITWSAGRPVMALDACPDAPLFLRTAEGDPLMLIGTGGNTLTAVVWRGPEGSPASSSLETTGSQSVAITSTVQPTAATAASVASGWSKPRLLSFSFEHPELGQLVHLDHLQATLAKGKLVVVGLGQYGDVWYLGSVVHALHWAFVPPPDWAGPVNISHSAGWPGSPSIVADSEGRLHALWTEAATEAARVGTLHYARLHPRSTAGSADASLGGVEELSRQWSHPALVLASPERLAMHPALQVHEDRLYAVWVGGQGDALYISSAFVRDAYAPEGWSEPVAVPMGGVTVSSPRVLVDAHGVLHVVYAAPLNEGRGIYYLRSDRASTDQPSDGARTARAQSGLGLIGPWSQLHLVFDAQAAGFAAVDHPHLALDAAGTLHVVWVHGSSAGPFPPQAVLHAQSTDGGLTWSEPRILAEGAYDWPLVAASLPGDVHVLWNEVSDGNAWSHRWSLDSGQTWTYQQRVRGFEGVPGPVSLTADGAGDLYLVGLQPGARSAAVLAFALWRWEEERWEEQEPFRMDIVRDSLPGVAVALLGDQGRLDAVFRASMPGEGEMHPVVLHARRRVAVVAAGPLPSYTPSPAVAPTLAPTALPTSTSRPPVEVEPPQAGPPTLALGPLTLPLAALGGIGLALIIIIGILVTRGRH